MAESTYLLAVKQTKLADLKSLFNLRIKKDKSQKFSGLIDHADSMKETMNTNKKKIFGALRKVNVVTHTIILRNKHASDSISEQEENL